MKRNTKAEREKELLRLEDELHSNWEAQWNLGFKPLKKPIPHGYRGKWTLRADVARRQDADRLQYVLDHFSKSVWCRREDFKAWCYHRKEMVDVKPSFRELKPKEYEGLKPWIQKFFDERERYSRWGNYTYTYYAVNIPSHFLVLSKKRDYKTHYKVIDEVLKQEAAEIEARLDSEFYNERRKNWGRWRSSKTWRKIYNKAERAHNKKAIKQNIMSAEQGEYYDEVYELKNKGNRNWW